jgi:hypothetical protein
MQAEQMTTHRLIDLKPFMEASMWLGFLSLAL